MQARSQDLEGGGVHFRCQLTKGSKCVTQIFQLGAGGSVSPQRGLPRRQTHFDNNVLKIGLKSGI